MFGIALDLRPADFRRVVGAPRSAVVGLTGQLVLLPALTFGLVVLLEPPPSMALGMMLVAACPGGNVSNFFTHLAGGSTALSVSLSAISTTASMVTTPVLLGFWAGLHPPTARLLREVAVDPLDLLATVAILLGVPIVAGMTVAARHPKLALRLRGPLRILSLLFLAGFVVVALVANFQPFLDHIRKIAGLVLLHNGLAFALGFLAAFAAGLPARDRRAVTLEVGIQNSGLGLVLIFAFFGGLGGMALVAAWWGVWHLLAGFAVAAAWSRISTGSGAGGVERVEEVAP